MNFSIRLEALTNEVDPEGSLGKLEEAGSLNFSPETINDPVNISFAYDAKAGKLSLVKGPNDIISVTGFLTPSMLGTGKRGIKGKRGSDGKAGRTGFDGRTGKTGCPGIPGPKGKVGALGKDGEDGPIGPIGRAGDVGEDGERGDDGDKGIIGHEGSQGLIGSSCLQGEEGPIGVKPLETVYYSKTPPVDDLTVFIWAEPIGNLDPDVPDVPNTPMSARVDPKSMNVPAIGSGWYQGALFFKVDMFQGGVGPFTYKWSGDYSAIPEVIVIDTGETSSNLNLRCRVYINETVVRKYEGNLSVEITDTSNGKKVVANSTYSFTVSATASNGGNPPGGGGGGCIVYGQQLTLVNGQTIPVQSILVGDTLIGCDVVGVPDSSNNTAAYLNWNSSDLSATNTEVFVRKVEHSKYNKYYKINNELCLTLEEALLAKRGKYWKFIRVVDLRVGDYLHHISGQEKEVTSIEILSTEVNVVSLDVETIDMFYVNGYLLHNRDEGGPIMKN